MLRRSLLLSLGLFALTCVLAVRSDLLGQSASKDDKAAQADKRDKVTLEQLSIARQFREFEDSLLKLKQRYERSSDPAQKDRAIVLQKVLDKIKPR